MEFQVLESERLILRKIEEKDAKDLYEYLSDDKVTKYLGKGSFKSIYEAYELIDKIDKIDKNYKEIRSIRWAICLKINNKLIGTMGLDGIHFKNKRCDIGYDLNSKHWKQGIATEAMELITKHAFERLYINRIGQ